MIDFFNNLAIDLLIVFLCLSTIALALVLTSNIIGGFISWLVRRGDH